MNMLVLQTAGESHGPAVTGILAGFPSGITLDADLLENNLSRRRGGKGRSSRMARENDVVVFTGGILDGRTTGSPVCFSVENRVVDGGRPPTPDAPFIPRPGHADLPGVLKHGFEAVTPVSERASARATVISVVAGSLASMLLRRLGVDLYSWVTAIGAVEFSGETETGPPLKSDSAAPASPAAEREKRGPAELAAAAAESPVYCPHHRSSASMVREIELAAAAGDSLGGAFRLAVCGLPPGIGGYETPESRLEGRLAGALMAIPSVRGVHIGDPGVSRMRGSDAAGGILPGKGAPVRTGAATGGGIEGGMTTGETISALVLLKPVPTIKAPLPSVDLRGNTPAVSPSFRADTCVVPAASVVGEAVAAIVIADAILERFGGGPAEDLVAGFQSYRKRIGWLD